MPEIDTIGTYIGEVIESAISATKNGFPQWTPRLKAVKKYIETADELAHYQLTEPGYIDYSQFDESTIAFLTLFGAPDGGEPTPTLSYEQAKLAVGWEGNDFETLNASVGKRILFRVENHTYKDKESLKVTWIDAEDASPTKTLKALDPAGIKDLSARFLKNVAKPAVVAAKPVSKPAATKPGAAKPGKPGAASAASTPATTVPSAAAPSTPTTPPVASPKPPAKKTAAPAPAAPAEVIALPAETSQGEAWEYLQQHKGANADADVESAWLAACGEVGGAQTPPVDDQDNFTPAMWAGVRDKVIADMALS